MGTAVCGRRSSRVGYVSESFVAFANRGLVPFHERSLPCHVITYIRTNERKIARALSPFRSTNERTNERSNELASDDDDSGVDSHGYRDATAEVVRESRGSARDDDLGPSSVPVPVLEEERGAGSTERATERLIS